MKRTLVLLLLLSLPALAEPPVNQLAIRLYPKLAAEKKGENLFFSPYSVSVALAMAAGGAQGETRAQMLKVLGSDKPQVVKSAAFKEGNRVWLDKSLKVKEAYLAFTRRFGAEATRLDIRNATEASRQTINAWVSKQTAGMIPDLIPRNALKPVSRMVLTNAIYFKDDWKWRFEEKATQKTAFHLIPKGQAEVPLMSMSRELAYGKNAELAVCELPYQGDFVMTVILPHDAQGLSKLEKGLNPAKWVTLLGPPQKVELGLPRFKTRTQAQLQKPLSELGMPLAFEDKADFFAITDEPLKIGAVIHEGVVEVNEKGTVAAAATAVVTVEGGAAPGNRFLCDHPFLYLIRHKPTGTIVFMGRFMKP